MSIDTTIGIAGIFLAIVGILLAYIFYVKSLKNKEPYYSITSNTLIEKNISSISNLTIHYNKAKIENITSSKVFFGNMGKEPIEFSDIAEANPLRIVPENGVKILDATVIKDNNKSSQFKVSFDKKTNHVDIIFDYINHDQWVIIQILHTGTSSKDMKLFGDFKSVKEIKYIESNNPKSGGSLSDAIFFTILFIASVIQVPQFVFNNVPSQNAASYILLVGILFILFTIGLGYVSYSSFRDYFKRTKKYTQKIYEEFYS